MKRKLASASQHHQQWQLGFTKKQLRSKLTRRRRVNISPFPVHFSSAAADSSDLVAAVTDEVSCNSSIASVSNHKLVVAAVPQFRNQLQKDFSRSYYRKRSRKCAESVELSENSCVESCPGVNNRELMKLNSANVKESEVSSTSPRFSFSSNYDAVRVSENVNSVTEARNDVVSVEIPGAHTNDGEKFTNSEATSHGNRAALVDLTCSEQFSNGLVLGDDVVEQEEQNSSSSSENLDQLISDLEFDDSQYTPSFWCSTSGSQFSERSIGDESCSPCFQLFKHFKQQFCRSSFTLNAFADDYNCPLLGLGNIEDEESYKMLRKRERRQVYLRDYAEEYCNATAFGDIVIQQRLHMVHWIVEQATNKELQMETMFLGVSLLDRFLSKGYFKTMKNLQIAGISCLTLATRIQENQPDNCIREETFCVGKNTYARREVVAMEWLVQEVLSFQCFLPTLYNFLWYYLKAARANKKVEKTTKYLAVLALMGHQQLCFWPSVVAAGLVILASIAANQDTSCHLVAAIHAKENDKDLPECIKSLEWLVKYL